MQPQYKGYAPNKDGKILIKLKPLTDMLVGFMVDAVSLKLEDIKSIEFQLNLYDLMKARGEDDEGFDTDKITLTETQLKTLFSIYKPSMFKNMSKK